ncbi:MAG: bifunctional diaminohydroxyphosphoribosylaminopyrimidine deaminase/5-amino-6-(5-phosphoribosylamino)uracil reductase RibD [Pseudomonadota bacterium]
MISKGQSEVDKHFMRVALRLARRGIGQVAPNPAVGCVIVKDGKVVGRGWTAPNGRPHAEARALEAAGQYAQGATAYVTLEPCAHFGKTPPCAAALINSGIRRVVSAVEDPDERVAGRGHAMLRHAGISVDIGLCAEAAHAANLGFILNRTLKRPFVTAKVATSLDARIATVTGASKWITGEPARAHGHLMRAKHDAILIGAGTLRADNPILNCRLSGLEARSPIRVIVSSSGDLPEKAKLFSDPGGAPIWVATPRPSQAVADHPNLDYIHSDGIFRDGSLQFPAFLKALAERGVTRLLIEGGGQTVSSALKAGSVDQLLWYRAPKLIGADGHAAIGMLDVQTIEDAVDRFRHTNTLSLGDDELAIYNRR